MLPQVERAGPFSLKCCEMCRIDGHSWHRSGGERFAAPGATGRRIASGVQLVAHYIAVDLGRHHGDVAGLM